MRYGIVKRCLFISENEDFRDCGRFHVIESQGAHYIKALIAGGRFSKPTLVKSRILKLFGKHATKS